MIIATQDSLYCIKRKDGENLWVNDDVSTLRNKKNLSDLHFALNEFNQLDSGVIISVRDNKITFLSNISGEEVASYEFDEKIKFVSDYDKIFKCLYVITDKKVIKLRIIVEI
jgi:transcription elongation factor